MESYRGEDPLESVPREDELERAAPHRTWRPIVTAGFGIASFALAALAVYGSTLVAASLGAIPLAGLAAGISGPIESGVRAQAAPAAAVERPSVIVVGPHPEERRPSETVVAGPTSGHFR